MKCRVNVLNSATRLLFPGKHDSITVCHVNLPVQNMCVRRLRTGQDRDRALGQADIVEGARLQGRQVGQVAPSAVAVLSSSTTSHGSATRAR